MPTLRFVRLQTEQILSRYQSLGVKAKLGLAAYAAFNVFLAATVFYLGPAQIGEYMARLAAYIREMQFGYLIVILAIICASIPPVIGYGASVTICGFAFGLHGFVLAIVGTLLGAAISFTICRRFIQLFRNYLDQFEHFVAFNKAVRAKGLPLLTLIRLSPFPPFTYSNLFCASIESVSLAQLLIASVAVAPKLLLHVWIGDRMYRLADPDTRGQMDDQAKWVNTLFIAAGALVGLGTGLYSYQLTMHYVQQIALEDDAALTRLEEGPSDDEGEGGNADMTTDELDRELRSQGIDPTRVSLSEAGEGWGEEFSDFDETEGPRKSIQLEQARRVSNEDDLITPRAERTELDFQR